MRPSFAPLPTASLRRRADLDREIQTLQKRVRMAEERLISLYVEGIEENGEPYNEELFDAWQLLVSDVTCAAADRADPGLRLKVLDAIYSYSKSVASMDVEEY